MKLELLDSIGDAGERVTTAKVLVPAPDVEFGVVSDIDDTIVVTKSTEFLRQMAILFANSARDRLPLPGVPALYRALSKGADNRGENPIFYVSMSGWNLYDLLTEFMDVNDIPEGPLFLTDLRFVEGPSALMGSQNHKFDTVDILLRTYPELPFILIGDSGMHDPEIYAKIVKEHPGRIKAIYIHDVSDSRRDAEVEEITKRLEKQGVPMLRVASALAAAEHPAREGLISNSACEEVKAEAERQRAEKGPDSVS